MASRNRGVVTRRDVLRMGAVAAGAGALGIAGGCGAPLAGAEGEAAAAAKEPPPAKKVVPIALQLYSVRGDCGKDFDGTVEAVAKMGYEGVEFAGYYKYGGDPKGLRKLLDDNGLKAAGTHTGLGSVMGGALERTVEFHKTIGNRFLIVPGLPGNRRNSIQAWRETAKLFSDIAAKVKDEGMRVGYHNHSVEFRAMEGEIPWDVFAGNTVPEVVLQLDTGNCMGGGGDPVAYLRKYPGRAVTTHLKEHGGRNAVLGDGDVKWDEYLPLCEEVGGTEWFIVEQERYPKSPLESARDCLVNLKKLLGRE